MKWRRKGTIKVMIMRGGSKFRRILRLGFASVSLGTSGRNSSCQHQGEAERTELAVGHE